MALRVNKKQRLTPKFGTGYKQKQRDLTQQFGTVCKQNKGIWLTDLALRTNETKGFNSTIWHCV